MKIVVVSDTHRDLNILERIERENRADLYLHAGDSCLPSSSIWPFISVKGNCDFFDYPIDRVINLEDINIYLTHGVMLDSKTLASIAKSKGCKIAISGHTHKYKCEIIDDVYVLNPGSPNFARDGKRSFMIINIDSKNIEIVKKELESDE